MVVDHFKHATAWLGWVACGILSWFASFDLYNEFGRLPVTLELVLTPMSRMSIPPSWRLGVPNGTHCSRLTTRRRTERKIGTFRRDLLHLKFAFRPSPPLSCETSEPLPESKDSTTSTQVMGATAHWSDRIGRMTASAANLIVGMVRHTASG